MFSEGSKSLELSAMQNSVLRAVASALKLPGDGGAKDSFGARNIEIRFIPVPRLKAIDSRRSK